MTIHEKLVKIQQELKVPKNQKNSHFGYSYRSGEDIIEAAKPIAHKHGCIITLSDEGVERCGRPYIKATAMLSDGENSISVTAEAGEPTPSNRMDASQCSGSASTYARKYALNGLLAIDDTKDADATSDGTEPIATSDKIQKIQDLCKETDTDLAKLNEHYKIDGHKWPVSVAETAIASLEKKLNGQLNKAA